MSLEYITVPLDAKALPDDEKSDVFKFEGLASTFGNIDLVGDIIQRGAFQESLAKETPVILWQHDRHEPIGMPGEIKETGDGLFMIGNLPKSDTFVSGRVIPQMKIGSIKSMSIGFRRRESSFDEDTGIRTLIKVDLKEVSLVTFPANPMALVSGFKSLGLSEDSRKEFLTTLIKELGGSPKVFGVEDVKDMTQRHFEKILRESGLFSKEASVIIANQFKNLGDPDDSVSKMISDLNKSIDDMTWRDTLKTINQSLEKL